MTTHELGNMLLGCDNVEVMILDGTNGSGTPRTMNFGPVKSKVTEVDADNATDCEEIVGQSVIVIGYGCY
jgi:hypothetical protein